MDLDRIRDACELTHMHVRTMARRRLDITIAGIVPPDAPQVPPRHSLVRIALAAGFAFFAVVVCR